MRNQMYHIPFCALTQHRDGDYLHISSFTVGSHNAYAASLPNIRQNTSIRIKRATIFHATKWFRLFKFRKKVYKRHLAPTLSTQASLYSTIYGLFSLAISSIYNFSKRESLVSVNYKHIQVASDKMLVCCANHTIKDFT